MSEPLTPLQDTEFEAEINFISLDPDTGDSTFLPIDLASVTYFEINDNIIDFGITGSVTFPNWGQLLSKLPGVTGNGTDLGKGKETHSGSTQNFLTIHVNDIDIDETGTEFEDNGYSFLAVTKSSASLKSNAINIKQTVDFEEDMTAILKTTSWDVFVESDTQYRVSEGIKMEIQENQVTNFNPLGGGLGNLVGQKLREIFFDGESPEEQNERERKAAERINERAARQRSKSLGQEETTLAKAILGLLNSIEVDSARMSPSALELDETSIPFGTQGDFNIFDEYSPFQGPSSKSLYSIIQSAVNHLFFNKNFSSYINTPTAGGVFDGTVIGDVDALGRRFGNTNQETPADLGFMDGATLPLLKTQAEPIFAQVAQPSRADIMQGREPQSTRVDSRAPASRRTERKLILKELLSKRHMEFVTFYKEQAIKDDSDQKKSDKKKEKVDYSDVYMEEFSIAPSDASDDTGRISTDSSIHNVVEMYDLIQPDINNLRQTLWGNYETDESGPDGQAFLKYEYNRLVTDFEIDILKGNKSNLPSIPDKAIKNFKLNNIAQQRRKPALTESKLRNVIYKSFILLNETIVLNVKGKMYRKPGKFITIKGDLSPSAAEELWYVIEVKHKFENGIYRNEIKAVRFLADGDASTFRMYDMNKYKAEGVQQIQEKYKPDASTEDIPVAESENVKPPRIFRTSTNVTPTDAERAALASGKYTTNQLKSFIQNARLPANNAVNRAFKASAEEALTKYVKTYGFRTKEYQDAMKALNK